MPYILARVPEPVDVWGSVGVWSLVEQVLEAGRRLLPAPRRPRFWSYAVVLSRYPWMSPVRARLRELRLSVVLRAEQRRLRLVHELQPVRRWYFRETDTASAGTISAGRPVPAAGDGSGTGAGAARPARPVLPGAGVPRVTRPPVRTGRIPAPAREAPPVARGGRVLRERVRVGEPWVLAESDGSSALPVPASSA